MYQPNLQDIALGRRIRLRRKLLKMTQRELAKLCGDVSFQQIQKYGNG